MAHAEFGERIADRVDHRPQHRRDATLTAALHPQRVAGSPPISFCTGAVRDGRFIAEGIAFEVPNRLTHAARAANGAITIGVRPEFLQPEGGVPADGVIAAVEPHGRGTLYTLTLAGGAILRSVQTGRETRRPGESVRWGLDTDAVLFFDAAGERI